MLQADGRVTADQTFDRHKAEEWFFKKVSLLPVYDERVFITPSDRFEHFMNGTSWDMRKARVRQHIESHDLLMADLGKNSEGERESVHSVFLRLYGDHLQSKKRKPVNDPQR